MAHPVRQTLALVSIGAILVGIVSVIVRCDDEVKPTAEVILPIPIPITKNPCELITCTKGYYCQSLTAKSCCAGDTICAQCIRCPKYVCQPGCFPTIQRNGCEGTPCFCKDQPQPIDPVTTKSD